MKKFQLRPVVALFALVVSLLSARADTRPSAPAAPATAKELRQGYRDDVVLAKPRAAFRATAEAAEQREGRRIRRRWDRFDGLRVLELAAGETPAQAIARLEATGRYEYVQRDYIIHATATPNDPSFNRQWPLSNDGNNNGIVAADIGATSAWDVRNDASSVIVAVIDSGVKLTHPDLAANLWRNAAEIPNNGRDDDGNGYVDDVYGVNAINNSGNPDDDHGHGTHVAGIVGAVGNNGTGISGVAWKVQIMSLKFLRAGDGTGTSSDGIECIDYAIRHGAHIINASWGSETGPVTQFNPAQLDAIRRARDAGIIFVAAAGNDGADVDLLAHYPSSHRLENIVAVGMSTNRDDLPVGSNYGSGSVELFAPGSEIYSTWYTTGEPYRLASGTSMAAPHVAGALALVKAQFPADSYRQLINRVLRSVDTGPAFAGKVQTAGRLNLDRALRSTDNRPFNDDFATRARVSGANLSIRSVNTGGTVETEPALAGQPAGATLWWEWKAPTTAVVRVSTDGSSYDTLLGVFSGTALESLTAVASNDNELNKITSRLEFTAQAGTTYQIVVGGKGTANGLTLVDLGAIPPNDNFASAETLTGRTTAIYSANAQATLEPNEPIIRGFTGGKSLWYRWTAPATDRFQFSLRSEGFDPLLAIYTGSSLGALVTIATSDNADREAGSSSTYTTAVVTVDATAGVTYFIQADGKSFSSTTPPTNAPFNLILNDSVWQGVTDGSVTNAPTVGPDGAVYVGSTDGFFHAFNADGTRRWPALDLGGAQQDTSSATLSPEGVIYIGMGPSAVGTAVSPGKVRAVDSATGAVKWDIAISSSTSANANNAIALAADGTIYLHSSEGHLLAYTDRGTSAVQKWSISLPGVSYASPTIAADGTIYLGSDEPSASSASPSTHRLYAINPADGSTKWTFAADNAIYTATAIDAAGNIYFGTLTSARLYSVTPAGVQRWVYAGARIGTSSSPALSPDGSTVYFAGYDGLLHAVNTTNGAQRWTYRLGKEVRASSPAVDANGVIYIGCYDNLLYAINADGTLKRTWSTGDIIRSSPTIAGTTLYLGSNDGGVYAFDIGASASGPWPQYRHNSRRTGRAFVEPPVIALAPAPQAVVVGATLELAALVTGTGPFTYQWFKDGTALAGATSAALALPAVTSSTTGNYSVAVSNSLGTALSSPTAVVVRNVGDPVLTPRLVNLSVRTSAGTGDQTLIVGFFIAGAPDKQLLIRGIGPTLTAFGVSGALADPRLQLLSGATVIAENDDWFTLAPNPADTFASVGAFPLAATARDSALIRTLQPGAYTAQITGGGGTGIALAELYDLAPAAGTRLSNVSARSQVGAGGDVLIAGFSITGNAPKTVLIRGIGPSLAALGVGGTLTDPKLELYRGTVKLDENNDWQSGSLTSVFPRVGAFALVSGSRDAALLVSLVPGSYTAQVSGVNATTGVALIEVYEVP